MAIQNVGDKTLEVLQEIRANLSCPSNKPVGTNGKWIRYEKHMILIAKYRTIHPDPDTALVQPTKFV
jgi:hypothetical protein